MTIRTLTSEDILLYRALRLRGLRDHPDAFGESAAHFEALSGEELAARMENLRLQGGFTLGAFDEEGTIVGTATLGRSSGEKIRHRGFLWGMYVTPEARGRRVGYRLVEELIQRAAAIAGLDQIYLAVVTSNREAIALYQSHGFTTYGTDPHALKIGDRFYDEYLMVKMLHEDPITR